MELVKSVDTIRFLEMYQQLLGAGAFKNQKDFCLKLKYSNTSFNQILNGTRNIPKHVYVNFCTLFSQEYPDIFKEQTSINNTNIKSGAMKEDHPMFKMMQQLIENNTTIARTNEKLANEILNLLKVGGIAEFQAKT